MQGELYKVYDVLLPTLIEIFVDIRMVYTVSF
jgi:hypothetical protein